MKTLKIGESYKHLGFILIITRREGNIIMAENPDYGYEVFRVKVRKESIIMDSKLQAGEYPPANSEFGEYCQFFPPRFTKNAHDCFNILLKSVPASTEVKQ
jgi:hypothetical protein